MGTLIAWLWAPCHGDPQWHRAVLSGDLAAEHMNHDLRCVARVWAASQAHLVGLLARERSLQDGEEEEPLHVA